MLTVLIWLGSGFAFAVGFVTGILLCVPSAKRERAKTDEIQRKSLEALLDRNQIGREQLEVWKRIANETREEDAASLRASNQAATA